VSQPDPAAAGVARGTMVVKVGSSSVTTPDGGVDHEIVERLSAEVATLRGRGEAVVVVSSGAIAAGWAALGRSSEAGSPVPRLQAVSAVGQPRLMQSWQEAFGRQGVQAGQVLLSSSDFVERQQYLQARRTLFHMLALGVVPVVNENDVVADDEIRFGDNDRLAALVAHLVGAQVLALLTDAPGLLTADPRRDGEASLIEQVVEIDHQLERVAGGPGTEVGSGGMASKLAAAKIATWSGVETVIADAARPAVLTDLRDGRSGVGTVFRARPVRLPARKLWIAFAVPSSGTLVVDEGARRAVETEGRSLLPAGVTGVRGRFGQGDAVEIVGPGGEVFAKGLVRYPSATESEWIARRRHELPTDLPNEVVHRDDLVVLR
jgi:glutamate 5-kinase